MAKVLVVDDEESTQSTIKSFLEVDGHSVSVAGSFEQAVPFLKDENIDLIVTDIYLGRQTGLDLLSEARKVKPNCPVIVVTGKPSIDSAVSCVRNGAFDYLEKPFAQDDFIHTTRRAIASVRYKSKVEKRDKDLLLQKQFLESKLAKQSLEIERATRALIHSEERYRTLVDTISEIIIEIDSHKRCLWCNKSAYEFFGEEIFGRYFFDILSEDNDRESIADYLRSITPDTENKSFFLQVKDSQGSIKTLSWIFRKLPTSVLNSSRIIASARDITEVIKLEQQIRRKDRVAMIGRLAGGVAHDFNNVLGAILAQVGVVKIPDSTSDDKLSAAIKIEKAVYRAKQLTDKLLSFAKGGKTKISAFNTHRVIEDVVELLVRTLSKQVCISLSLDAKHCTIRGDSSQIYQLILNLICNARDAIVAKKCRGRIDISTSLKNLQVDNCYDLPVGNYLNVEIADTGCGITKEHQQLIFEPFFSTKEEQERVGIGLAVAKEVVENHGGHISFASQSGIGTHFEILLPVETADAPEKCESSEEIVSGKGRILIVDDEDLVRSSFSSLLQALGYEVSTAESIQNAIDIINQEQDFDLIVLDVGMPGLDTTTQYERIVEVSPDTKILLTSGYGLTANAQKIMQLGAIGFVHKPCSLPELSKTIARVISEPRDVS
ncbi:MAG: response regulator [Deltaproteobacteria bacterium]|nr:response regulator [Deltaproteobacteria bacterium]